MRRLNFHLIPNVLVENVKPMLKYKRLFVTLNKVIPSIQ